MLVFGRVIDDCGDGYDGGDADGNHDGAQDLMMMMAMKVMMMMMMMLRVMMVMIVMMITRGAACVARSSPSPVSELCQITIARLPTTTADDDDDDDDGDDDDVESDDSDDVR